ncbi:MAG: SDR family oxidoreductase [Myxococcota bacterium]
MTFYLVTGATGFLGRELLARMLKRGLPMAVTTRRKTDETPELAKERLRAIIQETDPSVSFAGAEVVFADVSEPNLGLDPALIARLERGEEQVQIVHGAAEVRFDLPRDVMEKQNVIGTENILGLAKRLAERGKLARLDYVSTTYIAGTRTDVAKEGEIDVGQGHRNEYERSKRLAELAIDRERKAGLPVAVHRPSIIVGDSRTGKASSFKVLYWPLKLYARGQWKLVFGSPSCTMDVVPVDFVADAMMHLMFEPKALGRTFHLAAGPERQSTIGELVKLAERYFAQGKVRYVSPDLYMKYLRPFIKPLIQTVRPGVAEKGGVFLPYLKANPTFSVAETSPLLQSAGLAPPKVADYFGTIMRYAQETDFGRNLKA